MKTILTCGQLVLAVMIAGHSLSALADDAESVEEKIARAMSAAPSDISSKATIVDVDGTVLRKGSNGWTWVHEGPHLMMLVPSAENYAGLSRDPFAGGPYVMWDGTPLAHVMIPVAAKPE